MDRSMIIAKSGRKRKWRRRSLVNIVATSFLYGLELIIIIYFLIIFSHNYKGGVCHHDPLVIITFLFSLSSPPLRTIPSIKCIHHDTCHVYHDIIIMSIY